MIDESKLDFHESTVVLFQKHDNDIKIMFENVFYDGLKNATLLLYNVKTIETEAKIINDNFMATEDGEIIFLDLNKNNTTFVVQWNDYAKKLHIEYGYKIEFDNYSIILT